MQQRFRFDPINKEDLARWMNLSNGGRIQTMLNARWLAFGLMRGQLRQLYPEVDDRELTLKLFEELETRAKEESPNFSLFLDILHTLERINAPYMVIGAFVSLMYGSTRNTFDIDIIVDLNWEHIQQLVAAYPPPRYYADPLQMVESVGLGIMFNIIDTSLSDKADLVPISMEPRYRNAFQQRVRQKVDLPGIEPFEIWCARPEDIIMGKLMAWTEGRSRKHETDIYEMLAADRWRVSQAQNMPLDIVYIDEQAQSMGEETMALWDAIKAAVDREFQ